MASPKPKIFGELGLGVGGLKDDVNQAKQYITELSKQAQELGEVFKKIGIKTNLGAVGKELSETAKSMTKVTDQVVQQTEKATRRIGKAQLDLIKQIKHDYKVGYSSPEEAGFGLSKIVHDQEKAINEYEANVKRLDERIKAIQKNNASTRAKMKREGTLDQYSPVDYSSLVDSRNTYMRKLNTATNYKAQAEEALEGIRRQVETTERSFSESIARAEEKANKERQASYKKSAQIRQTESEKERKQQNSNMSKEAQALVQHNKEMDKIEKERIAKALSNTKKQYNDGLISAKDYFKKLIDLQKDAQKNGLFSGSEMGVFGDERKRAMMQSVSGTDPMFVKSSGALVGDLQYKLRVVYNYDKVQYLSHLNELKNSHKLTVDDMLKVEKEYAKVKKQLDDETARNAQQEANKTYTNAQKILRGSTAERFNSLSNFGFDATLIYGSIAGLREMITRATSVETQQVQLGRIMPEASPTVLAELKNNAFDVAEQTAQTVEDVQKIQNLWARTSDEIAGSKEAMSELTRVTAIGMNVGGFSNAEEAVQLLNATINQMGLSWQDASRVMDSWIKVADTTAIGTAKDLADMIMRTGTEAKLLGVNLDQLNGITGMMANNMAKSGEDVGTAMRTVFSYFTDENTIETLHKYGVEVKKNAREYYDFGTIMQNLMITYKKLQADNNQQGIREVSYALGRTRRQDYVGVLMQHWGEVDNIMQTSMDASGYAMKQNEKVMVTFQAKVGQLQVALTRLADSIASAGLLDALKGLVTGVADVVKWFNNLSPATRSTIAQLLELVAIFTVFNKTKELLFGGKGMLDFFAVLEGKLGLWLKNQTLVNDAVKMGAVIMDTSNAEILKNTGDLFANTTAQELNNMAEQQGTATSAQQTIAEQAETGAVTANTTAINANTTAQGANNTLKATSAGGAGLLSGALTKLTSILGLVTLAVSVGAMAYMHYKNKQEEARKETEAFKQAQEDLAKMKSVDIIPEYQIEEYNKKIDQMKEAKKNLDEIQKQMDEAQDSLERKQRVAQATQEQTSYWGASRNPADYVNPKPLDTTPSYPTAGTYASRNPADYEDINKLNELKNAYNKAKEEVEKYEKELKGAGTTTDNVANDVAELEEVVRRSSDATYRESYELRKSIMAKIEASDKLRDLVTRYEELRSGMKNAGDVTTEFVNLTNVLKERFPALAEGLDSVTGLTKINTGAIWQQIGTYGTLTQAQAEEIKAMASVSKAGKQLAIDTVNQQIKQTEAFLEGAKQRISIMRQELQALGQSMELEGSINGENGIQMMKSYMRKLDAIKRYGDYIGRVTADLSKLRSLLGAISSITPYNPNTDYNTPNAGDGGGSDGGSEKSAEDIQKEREQTILDMQSRIVDALRKKYEEDRDNELKALQEKRDAQIAYYEGRLKEIQDEIKALQDTSQNETERLAKLKAELARWQKDDSKYAQEKVKSLNEQIEALEKQMKIRELNEEAEKIQQEQQDYEKQIDEEQKAVDKKYEEMLEDKNVYDEANKLLTEQNQQEILDLLLKYAPDYANVGTILGKSMADAMKEEIQKALSDFSALSGTGGGSSSSGGSSSGGSDDSGSSGDRTYTVKRGDTLSSIAKKVYGSSSKWRELYDKNRDKISNPNRIYVGQVLRYADGGLVTHTGLAYVDGSTKKPEAFLNPVQTEALRRLSSYLPAMANTSMGLSPSMIINGSLITNNISIYPQSDFDTFDQMDNLSRLMANQLHRQGIGSVERR